MSSPDFFFFFFKKRNINFFTICCLHKVGQEAVSPNIQGQEDTVNHICLGCWPGEFLFPSIVGNAASPNHPSTPKTSQQKIVSPQVKSRSPAKMSGVLWVVGFCFFFCFFFPAKGLESSPGNPPGVVPESSSPLSSFWQCKVSLGRVGGTLARVRGLPGLQTMKAGCEGVCTAQGAGGDVKGMAAKAKSL